MSGKIEIGTRVRVAHKPEQDRTFDRAARAARARLHGCHGIAVGPIAGGWLVNAGGCWAPFNAEEVSPIVTDPDGLPVEDAHSVEPDVAVADLRADLASTKAAHAEAERLLSDARDEIATLTESMRHAGEVIRAKDQARIEANLVRADLDALQAAVRGLTGREGDVAAMVGDLAHVGRVFGDVVSLRADLQAARDTLSKVSAAVDVVRHAWEGEAAENMIAALDAVDRALRGVPAPASEARQCEACTAANGTATFHAPEEACDPWPDLGIEERLQRLEAALREQGDRLGLLSAAVESISVHGGGR